MRSEAGTERPWIAVLQWTEAFSEIWEGVAGRCGCDAIPLASGAEEVVTGAAAVLLASGGAEDQALGALEALLARTDAPVALVGAVPDHRLASGALRTGASDYFCLPHDLGALESWVEERADHARALLRAEELAGEERRHYDFSSLVGESPRLRAAIDRAVRVIPRGSATVLITGETGTGKELLAQAIHLNGPRAAHPFVEVNCTALPETLLEAELFGYEKGAFTDARSSKPGLFEAADGGSLFLDEIGDVSPKVQAKLLKVLEEKKVRRLGSLKTVQVDVRVIAATHVDLGRAVGEGAFRSDLYYRLNVLPIHLPPLRERGEDVLLLAEHFLDQAAAEYEVPRPSLDDASRYALLTHPWPGNVRELKNAIERAVLLGEGSPRPDDLFPPGTTDTHTGVLPFPATLREIEIAAARMAVERLGGNKSAAADLLGISRTRLYRLLEAEDGG